VDLAVDKQLCLTFRGVCRLVQSDGINHFLGKHTGLLVPLPERDQKSRFGHLPYTSILVKKGITQTFYWRVDTGNFPGPVTAYQP